MYNLLDLDFLSKDSKKILDYLYQVVKDVYNIEGELAPT